jgi:predicted ArsR family transcriptional regulator
MAMSLIVDTAHFRTKLMAFLREHTLDILWLISRGNSTQRAIANSIGVSITAVSRILAYLEAEGYIVSKPSRTAFTGRPQKNYQLSKKGEGLLQAIKTFNEMGSSN